jgi:hypothetical protein
LQDFHRTGQGQQGSIYSVPGIVPIDPEAKGDEVILNKGYGSANLEWNIPNAPSTKFRLGSMTKQFTTAWILLLHEMEGVGIWRTGGDGGARNDSYLH